MVLAATWNNVAPERSVPPITHTVNTAIPDNNANGVVDEIRIGSSYGDFTIEHIEVDFTATHPNRGDLEVFLTSPSGTVSRLATSRPLDTDSDFTGWRFQSVRHWGESAAGDWTLQVMDGAAQNQGTWVNWTLRIFGTQPDPPPTAVTVAATGITQAGATLNGTVNPNGSATTSYFEYGTTTSYGSTSDVFSIGSGTSNVDLNHPVSNLTCGTLYHVRLVAQNNAGIANGSDATFTTSACPASLRVTVDNLPVRDSEFAGDGQCRSAVGGCESVGV